MFGIIRENQKLKKENLFKSSIIFGKGNQSEAY